MSIYVLVFVITSMNGPQHHHDTFSFTDKAVCRQAAETLLEQNLTAKPGVSFFASCLEYPSAQAAQDQEEKI